MIEMKFDGLNKISNIKEILDSCDTDKERTAISRTRCSIPKHRKIFTKDGKNLYGYCDIEIIKSKGNCVQMTIKKDKVGTSIFEVENGIIKLR